MTGPLALRPLCTCTAVPALVMVVWPERSVLMMKDRERDKEKDQGKAALSLSPFF
jgi:hypothetical protein